MVDVSNGNNRGHIDVTTPSSKSSIETTNNLAKYYEELAKQHAVSAENSATISSNSANSALSSETNAKIWAEGTDEEIEILGGEHSSKGWVNYVMENAPTANVVKEGKKSTLTVTDIHGTTTTNIFDGDGVPGAGTTGQVLTKRTNSDYDVEWSTINVFPSKTGQCGKFLSTDGIDVSWEEVDLSSKQDRTDNNLTTTSKTIVGAINELDAKPSMPELDEVTITTNTEDELQVIGVIDNNNNAIKTWTGTKAQYNAITTKDNDTLYNITDDTDITLSLLEIIYPVGSIYITTNSTCPLSSLFGTWQLVGADRVLQGAGSRGVVGATLNESLPNIKGSGLNTEDSWGDVNADGTGVFYTETKGVNDRGIPAGNSCTYRYYGFDASRSSSTYQDDAPVQPDAYLVNIYRRVA